MVHAQKLKSMKVLQTIYDLTPQSGGPSTCVCDIMQGMHELRQDVSDDCLVELLTVNPEDIHVDNLGVGSPWLKEVPYDYKTPIRYSKNIRKELQCDDYDIYHANTLWTDATHSTCVHARKVGKPYLISPHGMLYPTALAISSWKKRIMLKLWFNDDINRAACLHATCRQEMEHCRDFGYNGPIAVIPNAVVLPKGVNLKRVNYTDEKGRRQIGFLGRLHPIKKVENIIYAIDKLTEQQKSSLSFQIMGKYDDDYEKWLKSEVERLGLTNCVDFVGFVSGSDKYERLSKLSALMVPSDQENFGMIVPEALLCGTPVYASLGTPWEELNDFDCGWWRDNSPEVIAEVLRDILNTSEENLLDMGQRGRKLIEDKYEQHKVAGMMKKLYLWMGGKGSCPEFVYHK